MKCFLFSFKTPSFNQSDELLNPIRPCLVAVDNCTPYEELRYARNVSQEEYNCLEKKCRNVTDYVEANKVIYKNKYCQKCSLPPATSPPVVGRDPGGEIRVPRGFFVKLVNFQNTGSNVFFRSLLSRGAGGQHSTSGTAIPWNNQTINISDNARNVSLNSTVSVAGLQYDTIVAALTLTGCILTSLCCVMLLITYALFKEKRTIPGLCIMSYTLALTASYILLIAGIDQVTHWELCTALGVALHFFFLSHFAWSSIISYDLLKRVSSIRSASMASATFSRSNRYQIFILYSVAGWGMPLVICFVTLMLDLISSLDIDYATDTMCWIQPAMALVGSVIVPICVALAINLVSFVIIIVSIHCTMRMCRMSSVSGCGHNTSLDKFRKEVRVFAGIFSLLGLQWIFGLLAAWEEMDWMWYLLIASTPLQGVVLVCVYVLNRKTRRLYGQLFAHCSACCFGKQTQKRKSETEIHLEKKTRVDT